VTAGSTLLAVQTGIFGDGMFGSRPETDLDGVLDAVCAAGYDGVEVMANLGRDPERLRAGCAARGLAITGLHLFWWERDDEALLAAAESMAAERLIVSCLPIKEPAEVAPVADDLRTLTSRLSRSGIPVLVHNHAPEGRVMSDGRTPMEALAEELSDLGFVIDLHWAAVAGTAIRTLQNIGPRCDYFHFKDGSLTDPKAPQPFDLGTGEVDLRGAWRLIRQRPLAVATVERGAPPVDAEYSLRHDRDFVRALLDDREDP
jgi:sugar phosphate isomerase/epimerase